MNAIASHITSLMIVYSTVYSDADQSKHQSSASLAFVWGIHRDRWIPRTKGQLHGKCLHLMTSSCKETIISHHYWFAWPIGCHAPCICLSTSPIARFMGPTWRSIWGRQDPGGPHVGPMNLAIWDNICDSVTYHSMEYVWVHNIPMWLNMLQENMYIVHSRFWFWNCKFHVKTLYV